MRQNFKWILVKQPEKPGVVDDCRKNSEWESWSNRLLLYIRVTKWVYYLRCLMSSVTSACGALGTFVAPGALVPLLPVI